MTTKALKSKINEINSLLNKLERMGCEYNFQLLTSSNVFLLKSYYSKEGTIDTFECNNQINKIRDIIDSIPIELITNLVCQFPIFKIDKMIGYKQIVNQQPNFNPISNLNSSYLPTKTPLIPIENQPYVDRNIEYSDEELEKEINILSVDQKVIINEMEERIIKIIDNAANAIGADDNIPDDEIVKNIDPQKVNEFILEFLNKFKNNNIPLFIMSNILKRYGIVINIY